MTFMKREFILISLFAVVIATLIFVFQDPKYASNQAFAFIFGCLASSLAGFIGMYTATKANVRTTIAAKNEGAASALSVAFFGGSVMGLGVVGLGVLGLSSLLFSFFHYVGSYGEIFAYDSFAIRVVAGLLLGLIYIFNPILVLLFFLGSSSI